MRTLTINNFDVEKIARSGQCFRMKQIAPNMYSVIHGEHYLEITVRDNGNYIFSCSPEELSSVWIDYFDLRNYGMNYYDRAEASIKNSGDPYLIKVYGYGAGLRILRQDLWEVMVSFMISQNNNIPRIKKTIEALCERYGSKSECNGKYYYTFPEPEKLTNEQELREMGLGYRAPFVANMAAGVASGKIDLQYLRTLKVEYAALHNYLLSICGIGPKVASCIELFGLHIMNAFPVDVWMGRIIDREYGGKFPTERYRGIEGLIQQYMFFYEIEHKEGQKTDKRKRYPIKCPKCGRELYVCRSIAQEMGMSSLGHGSCLNCHTFLHIEYKAGDDVMIAELWDDFMKRREAE